MVHFHRRLLGLAGGIGWYLTMTATVGLAIVASYVVQAVLLARVLGAVLAGPGLAEAAPLLAWIAGVLLVRAVLIWLRELAAQLTAQRVKERVRGRLYDRLLALGPGYLIRRRTGDVQTTVVEGVEALEAYFGRYLPTVIVCTLGPLAIVGYLLTIDVVLAVIVLAFALFVPLAPRLWDRLTAEQGAARWQAYSELDSDYLDNMQGMSTLKAFNATERARDRLAARAEHLYRTTMRQLGVALFDTGLTTFGMVAGSAAAIAVGALRVAGGSTSLIALFTVLFLARECLRPFGELTVYWHVGFSGLSSSTSIAELLDAVPDVAEPADPVLVKMAELRPSVELDGVTFGYSSRERPAVRELSLSLAAGEVIAIVGPSGAGKTTIVSLLLRFFDPQQGAVRIGGYDIRTLPLETVRAATAVVSQDTYLFHGSIADNIRLALPGATDGQVEAAARGAHLAEFVATLPDGYDTPVGERGVSLSGGQRQRLAIARALLKDAPVLILDEATSNVDAESEAAIRLAVERLTADRTTLIIAHRESTVRSADRVVVLADGEVIESGRPADLVAGEGEFARLVAAQTGRAS